MTAKKIYPREKYEETRKRKVLQRKKDIKLRAEWLKKIWK